MPDHAVERAGNADVQLEEIGRIVFQNRVERLDRRLAATGAEHQRSERTTQRLERNGSGALDFVQCEQRRHAA